MLFLYDTGLMEPPFCRHGWHGGLHVAHRRHRDAIFVHFLGGDLEICCFLVYMGKLFMKFRDLLGVHMGKIMRKIG